MIDYIFHPQFGEIIFFISATEYQELIIESIQLNLVKSKYLRQIVLLIKLMELRIF